MRYNCEADNATFSADAYRLDGDKYAIAWYVRGWQTEPDEDTHWSGIENRTGRIVCTMVGDDAHHLYDPEDMIPLEREEYCGECGQMGCGHDGLDRSE